MEKTPTLPRIIRSPITAEMSPQIKLTVFPKDEGQPKVDVIKLELKQIEGQTVPIYMTPCEALEVAQGLMSAVQMYLYNQKEYRDVILRPRLKEAKRRSR